LPDLRV